MYIFFRVCELPLLALISFTYPTSCYLRFITEMVKLQRRKQAAAAATLRWRHLEMADYGNILHSQDKLTKPEDCNSYQWPGRYRFVESDGPTHQLSSPQNKRLWSSNSVGLGKVWEFFSRNLSKNFDYDMYFTTNTFWKATYLFTLIVWFKYIADWWQITFTSPSWCPKNKSKKPLIFLVCSIQNYTG